MTDWQSEQRAHDERLAAATGAAALSVIFGVHHFAAAAVIAGSAGMGALLRRGLVHISKNLFLQPFCAAVLAGGVGALAVRYQHPRNRFGLTCTISMK